VELQDVECLEQRFFPQNSLDADAGRVLLVGLEEVGDFAAELLELEGFGVEELKRRRKRSRGS
jgi:hypothetical protein